ncbi:MAG TPA: hypothetical protein ENO12_00480, partial [Thermoplasmatales archaeon]|nr:hypothetical protein [Thermoplasmatales archaeon]
MMSIFTKNKTSARLLFDYAVEKWGPQAPGRDPRTEKLLLLLSDLYIKAGSYAILNKVAFWLAVIAGIMVLAWPLITVGFEFKEKFPNSAIVQTTVTGLAALIFAVYNHYKKRQMYVENLMRHIIYSERSERSDQLLIK